MELALDATKGLGAWRRDLAALVLVGTLVFVALRLLGTGREPGGDLVTAVAAAVGVVVLRPLLELAWNYRRARRWVEEEEKAEAEEIARMERRALHPGWDAIEQRLERARRRLEERRGPD